MPEIESQPKTGNWLTPIVIILLLATIVIIVIPNLFKYSVPPILIKKAPALECKKIDQIIPPADFDSQGPPVISVSFKRPNKTHDDKSRNMDLTVEDWIDEKYLKCALWLSDINSIIEYSWVPETQTLTKIDTHDSQAYSQRMSQYYADPLKSVNYSCAQPELQGDTICVPAKQIKDQNFVLGAQVSQDKNLVALLELEQFKTTFPHFIAYFILGEKFLDWTANMRYKVTLIDIRNNKVIGEKLPTPFYSSWRPKYHAVGVFLRDDRYFAFMPPAPRYLYIWDRKNDILHSDLITDPNCSGPGAIVKSPRQNFLLTCNAFWNLANAGPGVCFDNEMSLDNLSPGGQYALIARHLKNGTLVKIYLVDLNKMKVLADFGLDGYDGAAAYAKFSHDMKWIIADYWLAEEASEVQIYHNPIYSKEDDLNFGN